MEFFVGALEFVVDHVRRRPNATEFLTSYMPGEGSPAGFYEGFGFERTGDEDESGEIVMKLTL